MRADLLLVAVGLAGLATAANAVAEEEALPQLLEPTVRRHAGVLSEAACRELIALGEEEGFTVDAESIDDDEPDYDVSSQSIEVFERFDGSE